MADRETQIVNFYETTITNSDFSAGATSFNVASTPTVDGTNGITSASTSNEDTWFYLVIDPDSSSNREIVVIKTHTSGSTSFSDVERDYDGRQEALGAPADTGISHGIGTTVRLAVLSQHLEDMNDRLDTGIASLSNAIETTEVGNGLQWTGSVLEVDINGATDGTAIEVDGETDLLLIYDADTGTVKKVYSSQVGGSGVSLTSTTGFFLLNG